VSKPAAPAGLAARAHPYTPLVAALAVIALAFLLPAPLGPVVLALLLALLVPLANDTNAFIPAAWLALPFWVPMRLPLYFAVAGFYMFVAVKLMPDLD